MTHYTLVLAIPRVDRSTNPDCVLHEASNAPSEALDGLIGWPFPLAITLAFSAKESLYKALCYDAKQGIDFFSSQIINITHNTLTLELTNDLAGHIKGERWILYWQQQGTQVITLVCH
ncbi:hypothetical protein A3Q29_15860 [Providencia stuartii]|uniref:4'-phosphopantetheinyl transferase domain-containing protein n=1 Tax=Providencia stuartii TaxID=588 RepID=A0A1S1HUF9_PROST|nr:hypothetical protein A3Q29_15860 [Providencia stuartii]